MLLQKYRLRFQIHDKNLAAATLTREQSLPQKDRDGRNARPVDCYGKEEDVLPLYYYYAFESRSVPLSGEIFLGEEVCVLSLYYYYVV